MITLKSKAVFSAFMAALAFTSVSCQKDSTPDVNLKQENVVALKVDIFSDIRTKAVLNETGESTINKVEVFVFNGDSDGKLDVYGSVTGSSSISLNCTTGKKDIYALVNSSLTEETLKGIDTKQKFLSTTTLLQENKLNSFIMMGSKTETISSDTELEMQVSRFVSRIGIGSIKTAFTSPAYRTMDFIVKRIYLINAVGSTNFGLTKTLNADSFYNFKRGVGQCDNLLGYKNDIVIANGESADVDQYFYTLPNSTTVDSQDSGDSPRFTRLVVEATLGGTTYYYPISIVGESGSLEANKSFMIKSLTITRPGSLSPDVPFEIASSALSIEVAPWGDSENNEVI